MNQWDKVTKRGEISPLRPTGARAAIFRAFAQQPPSIPQANCDDRSRTLPRESGSRSRAFVEKL